jgi:hypothetical protein
MDFALPAAHVTEITPDYQTKKETANFSYKILREYNNRDGGL